MPEDDSQPETVTNYGIIPTGEAYRRDLKQELTDLVTAQEIFPSQYKQRRIDTLSKRLNWHPYGDREGAQRKSD